MTERSLQVTYRKGRTFAAYLHLSHPTGEKSARTVASPDGLLDRRLRHVRPTVGRRDHGAAGGSSRSPQPTPRGAWRAAPCGERLQARSGRIGGQRTARSQSLANVPMATVFVAGSRQMSRLPADMKDRLDAMIEKGFQSLSATPTAPTRQSSDTLPTGRVRTSSCTA